jgi:hypothetical protein
LPWIWHYLSQNPNLTAHDILSHPEINWYWGILSCNEFNRHPIVRKKSRQVLVTVLFLLVKFNTVNTLKLLHLDHLLKTTLKYLV